jgi:lysophospholipase L1-like esterase
MRSITVTAALATLALVLYQALQVRRRTPRLPAARGEPSGAYEYERPGLNLLVVGESSVAGVGVADVRDGLPAQIAQQLGSTLRRSIRWHAIGKPGATATAVAALLRTQQGAPFRADVVVLALGVNDVLRLRSPCAWYRDVVCLLSLFRRHHGDHLMVLAPVPPLWKFRCLPMPLRAVLGLQAFALDQILRWIASRSRAVLYVPVPLQDQQQQLACDGFHPSSAGYYAWASHMARAIAPASLPRLSVRTHSTTSL